MSLILFEDEHLLVVDKPAGWNTHAPDPYAGEGIYDWLKHREPRWARLAIIHRLDKETSGVLVFSKSPEANRSLTQQFVARVVRKKYLLLTDRKPPSNSFVAESSMVRAGEKYVSRSSSSAAERAETHFKVAGALENFTLVEAEPITGRTHQIRVHAAEHGFPIYGDTLYGGTSAARVFLHATELVLLHPTSQQRITFASPVKWPCQTLLHLQQSLARDNERLRTAIDSRQTTACRVVHGGSDGWPGLYVEKLGEFLLAQCKSVLNGPQRALLETLSREQSARSVYYKPLCSDVRGLSAVDSSPQLILGRAAPERFTVQENGLTFELSFREGYSVGLFLDQRDNRRRFLINHVAANFGSWSARFPPGALATRPLKTGLDREPALRSEVLNTFAYTCGFSVAAAKAGARVTSLDLSKKYLEWGKRNFALNQIDPGEHDFIYGDAFDWMKRFEKRGRAFDAVVLDPPTFSQSKESGTWQAEKNYAQLIQAALPLLKRGGVLFASTNAAKLRPKEFLGTITQAIAKSRRKILQQHYVPQPPDFPISRSEPAYLKTVWLRID
jgi:23S rRNA (cytosine1962-C5)-methyltransferase